MPSVRHSVKSLVAESLALPSAALGKAFFAECPTKGTRQRLQHSAKPWIPVVPVTLWCTRNFEWAATRVRDIANHVVVSCDVDVLTHFGFLVYFL
jgi:hypothetical protein